MPTAENAKLEYESGQQAYPMEALTNSGDNTLFDSQASLFSGKSGSEPVVRPNGLASGGVVSAAVSGSNDVVDVAALTCYLAGVLTSVSASADESITRPVTNVAKVNSITVTSAGAIAVVAGTDGTDGNFTNTRGADGGPPYIPAGSIEVAQVRVASSTAAPIASTEIFQVVNQHMERYDYPLWETLNSSAQVEFKAALPLIHTGDVPKGVYASYADPIFAEVPNSADFVPPDESYTVSSTQVYGGTLGSSSKSLGQGSFKAYGSDNVTDPLIKLKGQNLWFRFYPDRYKAPYVLAQGKLGISRSFPSGDNISVGCTISASNAATDREV